MKIVIEKGQHNWYASTEDCVGLYRGLLVVGPSMDSVIDKLPDAFKDLRQAANHEPRCNCGHLFELCPQADCTNIYPLELPGESA